VREDDGSTIPLILGFLLIALIMVAGSVALGDAYVQQNNLQSVCDGAAAQAASSVDPEAQRAAEQGAKSLRLADVQSSVQAYLRREPDRADVQVAASLSADASTVTVQCQRRSTIAFGSFFGFGSGIEHRVVSSARSPVTL
jgi:Flp pilus assembly protein TadG